MKNTILNIKKALLFFGLCLVFARPTVAQVAAPPPPKNPLSSLAKKLAKPPSTAVAAKADKKAARFNKGKARLTFNDLAEAFSGGDADAKKVVLQIMTEGAKAFEDAAKKEEPGAESDVAIAMSFFLTSLHGISTGKELGDAEGDAFLPQIYSIFDSPEMKSASDTDKQKFWEYCVGSALFCVGMHEASDDKESKDAYKKLAGELFKTLLPVDTKNVQFTKDGMKITGIKIENGEAKIEGGDKPKEKSSGSPSSVPTGTIPTRFLKENVADYGDYIVDMPSYLTKASIDKKNHIIEYKLSALNDMSIRLLQPFPGSKDLDKEVDKYFKMLYEDQGFKKPRAILDPSDTTTYKGKTPEGVAYQMEFRDLAQEGQKPLMLAVIIFQLGDSICLVTGSSKAESAAFNYNRVQSMQAQYIYLVHNIHFKNYKTAPAPITLAGTSWQFIISSGGVFKEYLPNGTYRGATGTRFTTSYDATRDKVTTTTWNIEGTWSLSQNRLTETNKNTKKTETEFVRIVYQKQYDGTWKEYLGTLGRDANGLYTGEVLYNRAK
jgi:hypothetical protein